MLSPTKLSHIPLPRYISEAPDKFPELIKFIQRYNLPHDAFNSPQNVPYLFNKESFDPYFDIPQSEITAIESMKNVINKELDRVFLRGDGFYVEDGHVKGVSLYERFLTTFPKEIAQFTMLQSLNLTENRLKAFPFEIRSLKHLKSLSVDKNPIEVIPDWIGELTELECLEIGCGKLQTLPKSIGKLSHLKTLIISDTATSFTFPKSFESLTQLEYFSIYPDIIFDEQIMIRLLENKGAPIKGLEQYWEYVQDIEQNQDSKNNAPKL